MKYNLPKFVMDYLALGAPEGERNDTLMRVAEQFRDARYTVAEAFADLAPRASMDGLGEHEINSTIQSTYSRPPREPIGMGQQHEPVRGIYKLNGRDIAPRAKPKAYQLDPVETVKMPEPMKDGARQLLKAAFYPGEYICLNEAQWADEKDHSKGDKVSSDNGNTHPYELWMSKLDKVSGNADEIFASGSDLGLFICINPLKAEGRKDSNVTAFRHVLVEFDKISIEDQWQIINKSHLPCTAIVYSGGKSLHAWVRVDAKDRKEYGERVQLIYDHFKAHELDEKNKNPSRLCRMANRTRLGKRQELLALGIGVKNFTEWQTTLEIEGTGHQQDIDELMAFIPESDPNCLIGNRWLCKGGSVVWIGQCIHGATPIFDPVDGSLKSIESRYADGVPFHVLARDGDKTVIAEALPPKRFSKHPMLKISFSNGQSITVTPKHRLLTSKGYAFASDVYQRCFVGETVHLPSISDADLSAFRKDALRCSRTPQGSQGDYPSCRHSCDEPLPSLKADDQEQPPSLPDARERTSSCWPAGDSAGKAKHTHPRPAFDRLSTEGSAIPSSCEAGFQPRGLISRWFAASFSCLSRSLESSRQLGKQQWRRLSSRVSKLGALVFRRLISSRAFSTNTQRMFVCSQAALRSRTGRGQQHEVPKSNVGDVLVGPCCPTVIQMESIVKMEWIQGLHYYYDFHVPGLNNYMAAGVFHHNSGIGKSSLAMQAAILWAIGRALFGIAPKRKLKSLFIQAENDMGDLAEMLQGVCKGLGITKESAAYKDIKENVIFYRDTVHAGAQFVEVCSRLIDKHSPDLIWVDPLLNYIGDDISQQKVCTEFLTELVNPISERTGVCWMMLHHTGKPSQDPKARSKWNATDYSYLGLGSSVLTNWTRAVNVVVEVEPGVFAFIQAKRGKRTGAKNLKGEVTTTLYLKHSDVGICWLQTDYAPPEPEGKKKAASENTMTVRGPAYCAARDKVFAQFTKGEGRKHARVIEDIADYHKVSGRQAKNLLSEYLSDGKLTKKDGSYYLTEAK